MLAIQAFCCYIPYIFWTAMQQRAGINLTSIVSAVIKANCSLDPDERNKQTEFAARSVDECLLMQREYRSGCTFEFRNCLTRILPCLPGKRSGNLLTMGYLLLKVLFVALPIAQIWFMSRYIGVPLLALTVNCFATRATPDVTLGHDDYISNTRQDYRRLHRDWTIT